MDDIRLLYASKTKEPEQADKLPPEIMQKIMSEPTRSVRPNIPDDLEYVGSRRYIDNVYFDYYRTPSGELRSEYRQKHQKIIVAYRTDEEIKNEARKNSRRSGSTVHGVAAGEHGGRVERTNAQLEHGKPDVERHVHRTGNFEMIPERS